MPKPDIDAFLASVRAADEPGPNDRARIHRAFGDKLARQGYAAPAPPIPEGNALPPAAAAPATTALGARIAWLLLGSAALTGALIAVLPGAGKPAAEPHAQGPSAHVLATAVPAAPPEPSVAVGEGASTTEPAAALEPRNSVTRPADRAARASRRTTAPASEPRAGAARRPSAAGGGLAQEIELIAAARADLQAGRADAALEQLAEHTRRFGHGALRDEREGLRVLSLCQLGRYDAAAGARDRFLARAPSSLLAAQVRAACAP